MVDLSSVKQIMNQFQKGTEDHITLKGFAGYLMSHKYNSAVDPTCSQVYQVCKTLQE